MTQTEGASCEPAGKAIVLFSDGTGNSSAKLFKTNVWRMYEALDLGSGARQIGYYDNGVGTSGFKPLAALGGIFGWGLKRNVLDLYSFLCRNYAEGDRIYTFGFSRGAFTVRVLVGLIASQGVLAYRDERELKRQVQAAWCAYIRNNLPRRGPMRPMLRLWRKSVSGLSRLKRKLLKQTQYEDAEKSHPRIRFIGVWDTVAAYGGPFAELVRAIDDWIRPLSLPNRRLSDKVDTARQALALDEEREAFEPLPWDEPSGDPPERIRQIWFTGMHSDVGGGYPDDSLAYVPLRWMMEEASDAGLALKADHVDRISRSANAVGPMHDSRAGIAAYYRYQPRNVEGMLQPPAEGTLRMQDPEAKGQGMRRPILVHESVFQRIAASVDGYAPITLPRDIVIWRGTGSLSLPPDIESRVEEGEALRIAKQKAAWDWVWLRRILYFATVFATLTLLLLPWLDWSDPLLTCGDARCVLGPIVGALNAVVPSFLQFWVDSWAARPVHFFLLLLAILILMGTGKSLDRRLRDEMRAIWNENLGRGSNTLPRDTAHRRFRESKVYQRLVHVFRWEIIPTLLGIALLLLILLALLTAIAQINLSVREDDGLFCPGGAAGGEGANFDTARPCNDFDAVMVEGQSYQIELVTDGEWGDGDVSADPLGLRAIDIPWGAGVIGAPFRRVVGARWMQPLVMVRPQQPKASAHIAKPKLHYAGHRPSGHGLLRVYRGTFTAPNSGRIHMFVNDAVLPFLPADFFYNGREWNRNQGKACVSISRLTGNLDAPLVPVVECNPA